MCDIIILNNYKIKYFHKTFYSTKQKGMFGIMAMIDELNALGVNTDEALQRFSGNSALYERMIGKFPAAANDLEVLKFLDEGDYATALSNAHTLKGVTGNLSLTPLYKGYTEIVNLLRANDPQKAKETLLTVIPVQADIIACIEKNK